MAVAVVLAVEAAPGSPPADASTPISPMALVGVDGAAPSPGASTVVEGLTVVVDVAVFETRVEVLGTLPALATWLGVQPAEAPLPPAAQPALLTTIERGLREQLSLQIDGRAASLEPTRIGFTARDAVGVSFRAAPLVEPVDEAVVGAIFSAATPGVPESASLEVAGLPEGVPCIGRLIDLEVSRSVALGPERPVIRWSNGLTRDPLPPIDAVLVRREPLVLPLLSLLALIAGAVAAAVGLRLSRRPESVLALNGAALLALALVPVFGIELPGLADRLPAPSPAEARAVTAALLDNVYHAFNRRSESAVYDGLARSLAGDQLERAYVENRKTLAVARAGGAQARVEVVELRTLDDLRATPDGGFRANADWTVAGSVTHFGHRHLRQNRYEAVLDVAPVDGAWKILRFDLKDTARER